jgi:DNA-directed RNA polymerase subunit RPC12/RpoP
LLHGIVYCGECGHKMVVQVRHESRRKGVVLMNRA